MNDLFNKLLILRTNGIGPVKYSAMISKFGDASAAAASLNLSDAFKDLVMREMDAASRLNVKYLSDTDPLYPQNLRAVKNHPPIITVRGNINTLLKPAVSIVGTRHATGAGMKFISQIAQSFAENNFSVVSGMAMGTDTAAHNGALHAPGDSQTIAVLAGGIDYIWPLENESLYQKILERGVIISEMPIGMTPMQSHFIQRNRWIAALAQQLILGEADEKSGSMSTAKFALDYGRRVFAVPSHPSDARSIGPNLLIKNGLATLCIGSDDFFKSKSEKNEKKLVPENTLLDKLGIIPITESVLSELVKKTISEIKSDLVVLELQGLIRKTDGGYVRI